MHLGTHRVPRDTSSSRIDDVTDARHRQGGLGDICGQHDAPAAVRGEDPMLFGSRQPSEQRQNLGVGQSEVGESLGGLPDLLLARQEDEDVALSFPGELLDSSADTGDLVNDLVLRIDRGRSRGALRELFVLIVVIGADLFRGIQGPVSHLDGIGPSGDLDDGSVVEVGREPRGVDGGRGDDDLEVATPWQ